MSYMIVTLEYGDDPNISSVCAIQDDETIYEDPNNSGIPTEDAIRIAEELSQNGLSDSVIEEKWILI